MIEMKRNYTTNMIMNVSGTLLLIHYFSSKHVLAINLPWSALKSKQQTCVESFFLGGGQGGLHQLFFLGGEGIAEHIFF